MKMLIGLIQLRKKAPLCKGIEAVAVKQLTDS